MNNPENDDFRKFLKLNLINDTSSMAVSWSNLWAFQDSLLSYCKLVKNEMFKSRLNTKRSFTKMMISPYDD